MRRKECRRAIDDVEGCGLTLHDGALGVVARAATKLVAEGNVVVRHLEDDAHGNALCRCEVHLQAIGLIGDVGTLRGAHLVVFIDGHLSGLLLHGESLREVAEIGHEAQRRGLQHHGAVVAHAVAGTSVLAGNSHLESSVGRAHSLVVGVGCERSKQRHEEKQFSHLYKSV